MKKITRFFVLISTILLSGFFGAVKFKLVLMPLWVGLPVSICLFATMLVFRKQAYDSTLDWIRQKGLRGEGNPIARFLIRKKTMPFVDMIVYPFWGFIFVVLPLLSGTYFLGLDYRTSCVHERGARLGPRLYAARAADPTMAESSDFDRRLKEIEDILRPKKQEAPKAEPCVYCMQPIHTGFCQEAKAAFRELLKPGE